MTKTWKIGYRFDDTTGSVKPWEVINNVYENGKRVSVVRLGSFKTEAAAAKSIPNSIKRSAGSKSHADIVMEDIGRIDESA